MTAASEARCDPSAALGARLSGSRMVVDYTARGLKMHDPGGAGVLHRGDAPFGSSMMPARCLGADWALGRELFDPAAPPYARMPRWEDIVIEGEPHPRRLPPG